MHTYLHPPSLHDARPISAPAQQDARHSGLSSPCHRKGSKVTVTSRTTESWLPHSSHVPHATALRSACRQKTRSVEVATHIVDFVQFRASNTAVSRNISGYARDRTSTRLKSSH